VLSMAIASLQEYNRRAMERHSHTPREARNDEIDLHGLIADEALFKVDRFLNDAFVAGMLQVRVVHGKGTGTLRQAVREMLKNHPLVESFRAGDVYEGGGGATVVELVKG
jgi:DNA mismatch repair protein MutS2